MRVGDTGGCSDGWITYSDNCYKLNMDPKIQSAARADCQSQGSELTSIIDASEADFIKSILYVLLFNVSLGHYENTTGWLQVPIG